MARTINLCKPDVISAYPITPQTHIVEDLSYLKANGEADFEFITAESEFAAASIIEGASAAGGRVYTATSSQGFLLMIEVLFNIAGMRLPAVLTCANRAVSAPINIWNDQQDSMTARDAGWIQLYAENNQAAVDLHLFAYKIGEALRLPVMVNMDGFVLTHTYETIDMPDQKQVDQFLPKYNSESGQFLDVSNPVSLGCFATPADYQEIRLELNNDIKKAKALFKKESVLFKKIFSRKYGLVDYYGPKDAKNIVVSFGSVIGTIKDTVDEINQKSKSKYAVLNVICFRPFPDEEIVKFLGKAKNIFVVEKDISLGVEGGLVTDVKRALYSKSKAAIKGFSIGLGGRDIRKKDIRKILNPKSLL